MNDEGGRALGTGRLYSVTDVAGHRPVDLDEFVGATTVTVVSRGRAHRLIGAGTMHEQTVLFQRKEVDSDRDDGQVWTIKVQGGGHIVAEPLPAIGSRS